MNFNYRLSVNLLHILLIAPLFAYVGYYGANSKAQAFTALMAFGILTLFYHGYKFFAERKEQSIASSYWKAINLFHMVFVAPLLIYIGYMGVDSLPQMFTVLLVLAPLVMLFHLYRAFQ